MNKDRADQDMTHPNMESLLRFADGAAEGDVGEHLAACEQCANWCEDLRRGEAVYRDDYHAALKDSSEAPPYAWADLHLLMKAADLELKAAAPRLLPARPQPRSIRWGAIAASVIAAFAIGQWWFGQQVSAAELLRRASNQQVAAPDKRTSIEIRTRSVSVIRPALWSRRSSTRPVSQTANSIRALFESARYDWEDPLSAQAFAAWRQSLPDRQDSVRKLVTAKQEDAYEVRTRTAHGPLAEAILTLRSIDLKPVRETLQFRDSQLVEIIEVARPEEIPANPSIQPGEEPRIAKTIVTPVTAMEELAVWEALHRAGADAGEPVEIDRDEAAGRIVVTALGLSRARRAAVEHAMAGIGRVDLRFREPQEIRVGPLAGAVTGGGPPPPLQSKLEARFGGAQGAEDFIDGVLEATESSLVRAHAIRKLAERFPAADSLDGDGLKRLAMLVSDHLQALEGARDRIVKSAGEIGVGARPIPSLPPNSWQAHTEALVRTTQRADGLLTRLLAVRAPAGNEAALLLELDEALAQWQASVLAVRLAIGRIR